jgi:transposase-like protein
MRRFNRRLLEEHGISQEAVLGENGLIAQLKKRVVERALAGELTHWLRQGRSARRDRQPSQRLQQEDGRRRRRSDGDRSSAGSERKL